MNAEKDATLEKDGPRYTLAVERRLAHAPEKVWRVLTERGLLTQWFPCDVEGGWQVGAQLRFTFLHGEGDGLPEDDLKGEVLAVDEPWLLARKIHEESDLGRNTNAPAVVQSY